MLLQSLKAVQNTKTLSVLKYQIMKKLIPDLVSEDEETEKLAMLDMIYFINESTRAKTALRKQLIPNQSVFTRFKNFILRRKRKYLIMPNESLIELKKRMEAPEQANELINYIIEHYYREQSLFLVKMVSENYYKLKNWLERIDK